MENPAPTSEEQAPKPTVEHLTPTKLQKLMRSGFDTQDIAKFYELSEAEVYNKLMGWRE
jgi:hypothetical protein